MTFLDLTNIFRLCSWKRSGLIECPADIIVDVMDRQNVRSSGAYIDARVSSILISTLVSPGFLLVDCVATTFRASWLKSIVLAFDYCWQSKIQEPLFGLTRRNFVNSGVSCSQPQENWPVDFKSVIVLAALSCLFGTALKWHARNQGHLYTSPSRKQRVLG